VEDARIFVNPAAQLAPNFAGNIDDPVANKDVALGPCCAGTVENWKELNLL